MNAPTANQQKAIASVGNILVVAGAGAGKTRTLVQRCLAFLLDKKNPGSLDKILMVTFTEAAAAEMRKRIRESLEEKYREEPDNAHLAEQIALLDSARICTLHSFCFQLVREHFYELELDPQVNILPEENGQLLARDVLDGLMQEIYEGKNPIAEPVQRLVSEQGHGWDKPIRELVEKIHVYTQTLPDPAGWFAQQFSSLEENEPTHWEKFFSEELLRWKNWWLPVLRAQEKANAPAQKCAAAIERISGETKRVEAGVVFEEILSTDHDSLWPPRRKTACREPIKKVFDEAEFLKSLCLFENGIDPLAQDWEWVKPQVRALLQLAQQFAERFTKTKREGAAVDFHDLEQLALELLWNRKGKKPTAIAEGWRERLRLVLVDEYQDINEAQDTILKAISREKDKANRFLVGDVKQSIYRFRLANPRIFLDYERRWKKDSSGEVISLSDNFRSHEAILNFVNPLFSTVMKKEIGGIDYDEEARLQFGNRIERTHLTVAADPASRVELHLRVTGTDEETSETNLDSLSNVEKEARLIAVRLREFKTRQSLIWKDGKQPPAQWSDMVILLRSPRNKAEAYAKEFARLGIPLTTTRTGFYDSLEVTDILNLLRLLDNPLQDLPVLAVLRSPFVGLSLDELAEVRMANRHAKFWTALLRWHEQNSKTKSSESAFAKIDYFFNRFAKWRRSKKRMSLAQLVETILDETHYPDWLLAQARGEQRRANIERLLKLTRQFDALEGQGLFRFIRFIESQQDAEIDLEPASVEVGDSVRLMSIHQSKGLEFPVVVVGDLGKPFNFSDLQEKIILDETYGLCAQVMPPGTRQTYPSLPYWLAQRRQKTETLGEEIRLLYVAMTRAAERLILFGTTTQKAVSEKWPKRAERGIDVQEISDAKNYLDWIGPWLAQTDSLAESGQNPLLSRTIYGENDSRLVVENETVLKTVLPSEQPISSENFHALQNRIEWVYPFSAAASEPAKTSVSALRRQANQLEEEGQPLFRLRDKRTVPEIMARELSASEAGTAHHTFLEFVSLEKMGNETDLRQEAERIGQGGILSAKEIAALNFAAIASFWNSVVGKQIFGHAEDVHREHPFTSRLDGNDFAKLNLGKNVEALTGEFVVLQGVIDIAVILPKEIWLLDFKTDQMTESDLETRTEYYRQQVILYSDALGKIYQRPVTRRWLHFLALQKTVSVSED